MIYLTLRTMKRIKRTFIYLYFNDFRIDRSTALDVRLAQWLLFDWFID